MSLDFMFADILVRRRQCPGAKHEPSYFMVFSVILARVYESSLPQVNGNPVETAGDDFE